MAIEMKWRTFENLPTKDEGHATLSDAMERLTKDGFYCFYPMEVLLSDCSTAPASFYFNRPAWVLRDRAITAERMVAWRPDPKIYREEVPDPLLINDPHFMEMLSSTADRHKAVTAMYEERPIFHFTRTRNNVINILKTGFNHRECKERMPFKGAQREGMHDMMLETEAIENIAFISMVCFCDMDKHEMVAHREQYGKYAIGLKKEWAEDNHVTPARYVHGESPDLRNESFYHASEILSALQKGVLPSNMKCATQGISMDNLAPEIREVFEMLDVDIYRLCMYIQDNIFLMKEYEGIWTDRTTALPVKRVFYKEREWRSVRSQDESDNLRFGWEEITDILVDSDDDIDEIVRCIQDDDVYQVTDEAEIRSKISIMTSFLSK